MKNVYSMTCLAPTVSEALGLPVPSGATGAVIAEMAADLRGANRVAILVTDSFGEYAWGLWQDEMPYLKSMHARRSVILRAVLPSITPVNFATMVAGAALDGHGVRTYNHDFEGETLFDVVRRAGGRSAAVGIVGYTGSKLLGRYADVVGTAQEHSDDAVATKIIEIVEADPPQFLIAQLGVVDDVFHAYGPSASDVVPMLRDTDARLKRLVEFLKPKDYGVIITSDHGQHDIENPTPQGKRGSHGTDSDQDCLVPCTWS